MTARCDCSSPAAEPTAKALPSLSSLENLLAFLAKLRLANLDLTTPDGFRAAVELLAELAELAGADAVWVERAKALIEEPNLLALAAAVAKYIEARLTGGGASTSASPQKPVWAEAHATDAHVSGQSLSDWLPIVIQILTLLKQLRGAK